MFVPKAFGELVEWGCASTQQLAKSLRKEGLVAVSRQWWTKTFARRTPSMGDRGEFAAARFLESQGLRIIARQARTRYAEIDLIALDGEVLVFVEVKTRACNGPSLPEEAVTPAKQRRILRGAQAWLKRNRQTGRSMRFDVVAVILPENGTAECRHLRAAFDGSAFDGRAFSGGV
jgi:putative endonuclease